MKRLYKGEVEEGMVVIVKGFLGLREDPLKVYMVFSEGKVNFRVGVIGGNNHGVYHSRWEEDGFEVWQVNDEGSSLEVPTKTDWTSSHYDVNYTLTEKELKQGFVRLDTYKVNKAWGINSVDATGCGFHILKTINRIPRGKNPLERELRAIIGQAKCWANEEGVDLSDLFK